MKTGFAMWMVVGILGIVTAGCNTMESSSGGRAADMSLYERLGGKPAITAVVDDFVGRVAADNRINGKFANANIPRLKTMLVDQICEASGGPCQYSGRDMKTAHAGMQITGGEFDALVEDLVATLDKYKVGDREKKDLLGALGPMKGDIVSSSAGMGPKDGDLSLPDDYKSWPKFLSFVQKPDVKQVRELYINPTGSRTRQGEPFPNGTVMVMEIYKAKADGDQPIKDPDGKLVKTDLAKVFVMGKNEGWGQDQPENLKNGSWLYAAYGPDGKRLMEDFGKCRACHQPQAQKDFVHKYDEYFQQRSAM
jgi:hemoglobin